MDLEKIRILPKKQMKIVQIKYGVKDAKLMKNLKNLIDFIL